jgi:proteasome assembly chaperone (PAC2) family protein
MNDPVEWLKQADLAEPMLVAAFGGWSDASDAATGAVRWLISHWHGERLARIRPDDFYDFTVARPTVHIDQGGQRSISWPAIEVFGAHAVEANRDFVLVYGREPHLHWPDFAAAVTAIGERFSASHGLTLGAFLGPVLHTAPVALTGYASSAELIGRMGDAGVVPSTYEGQTGIASILHDAFRSSGLPSVSLWAAVPFYLGSLKPNPRATLGLLSGLSQVFKLEIDLERLEQAADYFDEQIERQVRDNGELRDLIARLETQPAGASSAPELGERPPEGSGELPSADTIIKDLENFLRGRTTEGGSEPASGA